MPQILTRPRMRIAIIHAPAARPHSPLTAAGWLSVYAAMLSPALWTATLQFAALACSVSAAVEDGWAWPAETLETVAGGAGKGGSLSASATGSEWAALSDTSCPHAAGSVHVLAEPPRLLVAGGTGKAPHSMTQCTETLANPLAGAGAKWTTGSPLLLAREAHAGAVVNGTAYVFGGVVADPTAPPSETPPPTATAEMLDAAAGWVPAPQMPGPRTGVRAATLPDGRALLVGGFEGAPPHWSYLNTTLFFDGMRYTPGPELPCAAGPAPLCGLSNLGVQECGGSVFAIGGSGLEPSFPTVWRLDLASPAAWVAAPNLSVPLTWAGTACVQAPAGGGGGTLYTLGGFGGVRREQPATS